MKSVTMEELMDSWAKDCKIRKDDYEAESARTPELHSKYLNIMTHHNMIHKKLEIEYQELRAAMSFYYQGLLNTDKEFLAKHNLEPFQYKVLKTEIQQYLDADKRLNTLLLRKTNHAEIVEFSKSVMKELGGRTFHIRNALEWLKFTNGT